MRSQGQGICLWSSEERASQWRERIIKLSAQFSEISGHRPISNTSLLLLLLLGTFVSVTVRGRSWTEGDPQRHLFRFHSKGFVEDIELAPSISAAHSTPSACPIAKHDAADRGPLLNAEMLSASMGVSTSSFRARNYDYW